MNAARLDLPRPSRALLRNILLATALVLTLGSGGVNADHPPVPETEIEAKSSAASPFSGTWQLNEELSDDPREKIREQMKQRRGGRGGGPRGGGRGGFRGGRPGGGDGPPRNTGPGGGPGQSWQGAAFLVVQYESPALTMTDGEGLEHRYVVDGEARKEGTRETRAQWKGEKLVLQVKDESRGTVTRTFRLEEESNRLMVEVRIESQGRRPNFSFEQVYDRVELEEEASATEPALSGEGGGR